MMTTGHCGNHEPKPTRKRRRIPQETFRCAGCWKQIPIDDRTDQDAEGHDYCPDCAFDGGY